jgi:hypothetical protein
VTRAASTFQVRRFLFQYIRKPEFSETLSYERSSIFKVVMSKMLRLNREPRITRQPKDDGWPEVLITSGGTAQNARPRRPHLRKMSKHHDLHGLATQNSSEGVLTDDEHHDQPSARTIARGWHYATGRTAPISDLTTLSRGESRRLKGDRCSTERTKVSEAKQESRHSAIPRAHTTSRAQPKDRCDRRIVVPARFLKECAVCHELGLLDAMGECQPCMVERVQAQHAARHAAQKTAPFKKRHGRSRTKPLPSIRELFEFSTDDYKSQTTDTAIRTPPSCTSSQEEKPRLVQMPGRIAELLEGDNMANIARSRRAARATWAKFGEPDLVLTRAKQVASPSVSSVEGTETDSLANLWGRGEPDDLSVSVSNVALSPIEDYEFDLKRRSTLLSGC